MRSEELYRIGTFYARIFEYHDIRAGYEEIAAAVGVGERQAYRLTMIALGKVVVALTERLGPITMEDGL